MIFGRVTLIIQSTKSALFETGSLARQVVYVYGVDWNKEGLIWSIDNTTVRTL